MTQRLILLAAAVGLLTFPAAAPADVLKPAVALGPTTVLDGTAFVTGTLGPASSGAQLTINGRPVGVMPGGNFTASVDLGGTSRLSLAVKNVDGETITTTIPLTTSIVRPGGVIEPSVLADLQHAAVTVLKPVGGFTTLDGLPFRVEGSVLDGDRLSDLTVNGVGVLGQLSADRSYGVQVPGTTKSFSVTAVDKKGVVQETQFPVVQGASQPSTPAAPAAPAGRTVHASQAVGLRIAGVRYVTKGIKRTKRLRVVVTVEDSRGLLVHGASVGVRSAKVRWIARNPKTEKTNAAGRASFVLKAGTRAFGKRLRLAIIAKTPQAKARRASSVRLPRPARRR